jgi:hypothetical protein
MADLDGEIEATARAYVGAAVTETATFRAESRWHAATGMG